MVPFIEQYFPERPSKEQERELRALLIIDIWWEYAQFHICQIEGLIDPEHKWKEFGNRN